MTRNQIEYWNLQELKRSNAAKEQQAKAELEEKRRSNLATETESARTNKARENLESQNIASRYYAADTGYAGNLLGYKSSMANIGLGYANLDEHKRANRRNENIASLNNIERNLLESRRVNLQSRDVQTKAAESKSRIFTNYANFVGGGATKLAQLLSRR